MLRAQCTLTTTNEHTAFTRAITLLYALTLLTLLTHIQLNLLGTRKYVQSVRRLVREQQRSHSSSSSIGALFFAGIADDFSAAGEGEGKEGENGEEEEEVTDETERKFLTLSWWLLNVGWKDVADRVRSAVEGVFAGCVLEFPLLSLYLLYVLWTREWARGTEVLSYPVLSLCLGSRY